MLLHNPAKIRWSVAPTDERAFPTFRPDRVVEADQIGIRTPVTSNPAAFRFGAALKLYEWLGWARGRPAAAGRERNVCFGFSTVGADIDIDRLASE